MVFTANIVFQSVFFFRNATCPFFKVFNRTHIKHKLKYIHSITCPTDGKRSKLYYCSTIFDILHNEDSVNTLNYEHIGMNTH